MEGSVRSGVLKKKSSSGCLIIKKKFGDKNSGGGVGGLGDNSKEKNRARAVESDSSSSSSDEDESLEFMRRKVNDKRLKNGSKGHKRGELENRQCGADNVGTEIGGERKRGRLDLFEFDEYDEFDVKKMRNGYFDDGFKKNKQNDNGGSSSRNFVVDKKKQGSHFDGSNSRSKKGLENGGARNKGHALEDDEANMPISLFRSKSQKTAGEPIRLQGKNGVLKVMVNKKKKVDFPSQPMNDDSMNFKERKGSRSDDVVKKGLSGRLPITLALEAPGGRGLFVDKEKSVDKEKKEKVKPILDKGKKARDSEIDGTDTVLRTYSSKKQMKKEEEISPCPDNLTPLKGREGKEGKAQRGGSTEKQLLREKIRGMLVDAGWSIDYRPRRNRDYLDAVYINPSGTAYWSITKAYDALKKQLEEDNSKTTVKIGSPSFAPLAENLINKLTRQTKKKIKEEMKRKRTEDGMTKSSKRSAVREASESSDSDENDEQLRSHAKQNSKLQKGKTCEVDQDSDDDPSDDSGERMAGKVEKPSTAFNSNIVQGRTSEVFGRCTLMVRSYDKGENSDFDGYVPYSGKSTVLAWLIDSGTAQLSEKVQYMNRKRTKVMLEGWITRDGIHCGCCSKILTVSKFELHAGSKLRQPFQNIYLESGSSLLQCQIDAWNSQEESLRQDFCTVDVDGDDPDDDTCSICGDGGDLICCDSCPSTFHQLCLDLQVLPKGDWHCPNCTCKFCGYGSGSIAEENNSTTNDLNRCSFCEKKYHKSCGEKANALPTSSNGALFCGLKCHELYSHLQKIMGIKHELEAGFSWSLIQRKDVSDASIRGFSQRVDCNSKLAVALSVMDECFLPIIDRRSGINLIHNVVYNCGSNFSRLNYRGFYTVILERGDEIISAASIRLHGDRLAEMPFIGTREIYRRQGMCRRLLSAIETELSSLKVGQLIIPTISEHAITWTTVFGFHKLEDVHKKEMKSMNMLVFPGTDMLQKQLVKQENSDGVKLPENNQPQSPVLVDKSDRQTSSDGVEAVDTGSPVSTIPSMPISESDNTAVCVSSVKLENELKESSANLKSLGKSNNSSDTEHQFDHPANDNTNCNIEAVINNACEIVANKPSLESTHDSSITVTLESTLDKDSEKSCAVSCPITVINEEPLEKLNRDPNGVTLPVIESEGHLLPIEPSPDSADNIDVVASIVKSELVLPGVKIPESTNNNPQSSVLVEKSDRQASGDTVDAMVSGSRAPAIPTMPFSESDNTAACVCVSSVKPEVENELKESSVNLKTPGETNSSEMEHQLLDCPAKDNTNCDMKAVITNAYKIDPNKPSLESSHDSSSKTVTLESTANMDSGKSCAVSCPITVVNEEPLEKQNRDSNGSTLPVMESGGHLPIKPDPDSAAKVDVVASIMKSGLVLPGGVKLPESTNNQPQSPVLVEKPDRQISSDGVEAMDTGSPAPTLPPIPISVSDSTAACVSSVKPEVKNKHNESSVNLKSPDEIDNSSDAEHQLLDGPENDITNCDIKAVVSNACEIEANKPSLKSIHESSSKTVTSESLQLANVEVFQNAGPPKTVDDTCVELLHEEPLEKLNRDPNGATLPILENEGNLLPTEPSPDSAAKVDVVASVMKNGLVLSGVVQKGVDFVETDKPNGQNETPCVVNGKVGSPVSPCDALPQNTAIMENRVQ